MVSFKNEQWLVDEHGLQSVRPGAPRAFKIEAHRLLESDAGQGDLYDWPLDLAAKAWIDIEAFIEAYVEALDLHADKLEASPDLGKLSATLDEARRIVAEREDARWI
ncbi:MAG TPA: hypothetical protein VH414_14045 [Lichenihabitans sp.]|jgi:hypothetical protein|nr:hypothetical protein [Lichenihabitans sp.]